MTEFTVRQGDTGEQILITDDLLINTTGWTCNVQILDEDGVSLLNRAVITTTPALDAFILQLTVIETAALVVETYRMTVELANTGLTPSFNREDQHILNVEPEMETGDGTGVVELNRATNSFGTMETLILKLSTMPQLQVANTVTRTKLKAALIAAYDNIGILNTDFEVYDSAKSQYKTSTSDFTVADLDALTTAQTAALLRAQLIESDALLGGNPIEDRRRSGLLSDSAGESAIFMRTTKPLELSVYRATALALKGYIVWTKVIGRG